MSECTSGCARCYCLSGRSRAVLRLASDGSVLARYCSVADAATKLRLVPNLVYAALAPSRKKGQPVHLLGPSSKQEIVLCYQRESASPVKFELVDVSSRSTENVGVAKIETPKLFEEGDDVQSLYYGQGNEWYPGTIACVHKDGTYDVLYDENDELEIQVSALSIRVPQEEVKPFTLPSAGLGSSFATHGFALALTGAGGVLLSSASKKRGRSSSACALSHFLEQLGLGRHTSKLKREAMTLGVMLAALSEDQQGLVAWLPANLEEMGLPLADTELLLRALKAVVNLKVDTDKVSQIQEPGFCPVKCESRSPQSVGSCAQASEHELSSSGG